ncbi:hypothetical protein [Rubrivirga sp. IMCC43871]|uniref:hypothetical protein n=1 Tax=Rubrivirga sp. IMCC43871 TaxID=3391575 RepID=UPI0039902A7C
MRVLQTLRPGHRGTRRFVDRFGDQLVCVRYRTDGANRRVTTVELVVDERAWAPRAATVVGVRVVWGEAEVARRVKASGGVWDASRKVWRLRAGEARRLGLADRTVPLGEGVPRSESLDLATGHYR